MKIPGFSFWALVTAVGLYFLLHAVAGADGPQWLPIGFAIIWYLVGLGAAHAVYGHHHPLYESHSVLGDLATAGAPPGTFAVTYANQNKTVFVPAGTNLRKAAQAQGVQVYYDVAKFTNCRGLGLCGTCRFTPDPKATNAVSEPTTIEKFTLGADVGKIRLSCQTNVLGNCIVDNTVAEELGQVHHYAVINGALFGAFSLLMLGVILWIGADMIGLM